MRIDEVTTRGDLRRFVRIPRDLYSGLPGYEPPLDFERMQLLSPKASPFFSHGEAAYFIATGDDGRPLGRISAQVDRQITGPRAAIGQFGCLDAVDDARVVAALIDKARDWHARRGRMRLEGPFTLSINEEAGVQVDGQEHGAMLLMPWHPAYLGGHVEAAGLVGVKDLLAYAVDADVAGKWRGMRTAKPTGAGQIVPRDLDLKNLSREAEIMAELFNASWVDNWGFVPLVASELATLLRILRPILKPTHASFLEIDGKPAAFALALPNVTELYRGLEGRLLPLNWARLVWRAFTHTYTTFRFTLLGVRAELRDTGLGSRLPAAAIAELFVRNPVSGIIEMSWILDDNMRMRRIIERIGGTVYKRYRVYGDPVAAEAAP